MFCAEKLVLYETLQHMYLVGSDAASTSYRILKIDRTIPRPKSLSDILVEDPTLYSHAGVTDMLNMINEGNKSTGGLVKVVDAYGLVGFVKFLEGYYMTLITKIDKIGCVRNNFIYTIKETEMFPIKPKDDDNDKNIFSRLWNKVNKKIKQTKAESDELRYLTLFQFVDLTKDFYFSYTYDITSTLQHNYIVSESINLTPLNRPKTQDAFEWNYYQTLELATICENNSSADIGNDNGRSIEINKSKKASTSKWFWILPIIQGSYKQKKFSFFGKELDLILIARRSRHYAGTRYLKRGISVHGKVANDCETEQILQLDSGLGGMCIE
jgi:phosphatidylinositol 3,5-bisphosphate 5-phosphatase